MTTIPNHMAQATGGIFFISASLSLPYSPGISSPAIWDKLLVGPGLEQDAADFFVDRIPQLIKRHGRPDDVGSQSGEAHLLVEVIRHPKRRRGRFLVHLVI